MSTSTLWLRAIVMSLPIAFCITRIPISASTSLRRSTTVVDEAPGKVSPSASGRSYVIDRHVLSSGGDAEVFSESFFLSGTAAQTAVGTAQSVSFLLSHGFWQEFSRPACCIPPLRGNVDYDPLDAINIVDLTYLVDNLFGGGDPPPCREEADMNADGAVNIVDLTHLVAYLFGGGDPPELCF